MAKPLIILTGPTAAGKTSLSIKLAKMIGGEIISADSMQVYKKMDIGTAKITKEEMQGVRHHMIDILEPTEDFDVSIFKNEADRIINEIIDRGNIPIIVGGTGFYIQSVLKDVHFTEHESDNALREELYEYARVKGNTALHLMLKELDEESYNSIHENNVKRVVRAIEFCKLTGSKFSEHNETEKQKTSPYNFAYFVLNLDRDLLYKRIDKRVDIMLEQGLVEEVRRLYDLGLTKDMVSMKGLGYKEIIDYFEGKCSLEEAVTILKRDTRHFAKRQITWFKRENDVIWIDKTNREENSVLEEIIDVIKEKGII